MRARSHLGKRGPICMWTPTARSTTKRSMEGFEGGRHSRHARRLSPGLRNATADCRCRRRWRRQSSLRGRAFPTDARYAFVGRAAARHAEAQSRAARVRSSTTAKRLLRASSCASPSWRGRWKRSRHKGRNGFYRRRPRAHAWSRQCRRAGGIWELDDLAAYRSSSARPQRFVYRGAQITCASLPSSGGLVLAQSLQILERYPLGSLEAVERIHLVVEALRRGFQDRARYLGDPDFVQVPERLATRAYADRRADSIDPNHATLERRSSPLQRRRRQHYAFLHRGRRRQSRSRHAVGQSALRRGRVRRRYRRSTQRPDERFRHRAHDRECLRLTGGSANAGGRAQTPALQHDADLRRGRARRAGVGNAGRLAHHQHGAAWASSTTSTTRNEISSAWWARRATITSICPIASSTSRKRFAGGVGRGPQSQGPYGAGGRVAAGVTCRRCTSSAHRRGHGLQRSARQGRELF